MARTNGGIIGKKNLTSFGKDKKHSKTSSGTFTTQPGTRLVDYLVVAGGGGGGGDCGSSAPFTFGKQGGSGVVIIKEPEVTNPNTAPGFWTLNEVYDQVKQGIWTN